MEGLSMSEARKPKFVHWVVMGAPLRK